MPLPLLPAWLLTTAAVELARVVLTSLGDNDTRDTTPINLPPSQRLDPAQRRYADLELLQICHKYGVTAPSLTQLLDRPGDCYDRLEAELLAQHQQATKLLTRELEDFESLRNALFVQPPTDQPPGELHD